MLNHAKACHETSGEHGIARELSLGCYARPHMRSLAARKAEIGVVDDWANHRGIHIGTLGEYIPMVVYGSGHHWLKFGIARGPLDRVRSTQYA
jgi:hypothetical protein